mgnify:CR=1 FL=1
MWGKGFAWKSLFMTAGITPTHVGKSIKNIGGMKPPEDHPHPCGEKLTKLQNVVTDKGSPPPMWGKVLFYSSTNSFFGITPTHVGKSVYWYSRSNTDKDHPHPCGEKL